MLVSRTGFHHGRIIMGMLGEIGNVVLRYSYPSDFMRGGWRSLDNRYTCMSGMVVDSYTCTN